MTHPPWMLYGASGHTGTLIAEEAVRRGHSPLLAGRSQERLVPLAERLGLEWLVVDRDTEAFTKAVAEVDLVFQAAGPFDVTSEPVLQACLAGGTHYADIANELSVFRMMHSYDEAARQRGVTLMTGAGFGVIATDPLAKHVVDQLPDATRLEVAILVYNSFRSAGATKTGLKIVSQGGSTWKNGERVHQRLGKGAKRILFPDGEHTMIPAPLGDLEAIHTSTGIPTITIYSSELPSGTFARPALPLLGQVLRVGAFRRHLEHVVDQRTRGTPLHTESGKSYTWVHAVNQRGMEAQAWLEMGEGYLFSASASVRAVEQIFDKRPRGAMTPAQAFGTDFVLDIPGTKRYSTLPEEMH